MQQALYALPDIVLLHINHYILYPYAIFSFIDEKLFP